MFISQENQPARKQILNILSMGMGARAMMVAASIGLPDALGDEPLAVEELAKRTATDATALYRLMRCLASLGFFSEISGKQFEHTDLSRALSNSTKDSLGNLVRMHDIRPHYHAWGELEYSVRTGKPAFNKVTGMPCFDYLSQHPEEAEIFFRGLGDFTQYIATSIVDAYDFSGIKTIVELGGAGGELLGVTLKHYPSLKGVLFDLPSAREVALANFKNWELADRTEFIGGSFFDSVPTGADAYISKFCLHDWDDANCVRILKNIAKNMSKNGVLLIVEDVIPEDNSPSMGKVWDLETLVITEGGRERTRSEFEHLYRQGGLYLTQVIPVNSQTYILEGRLIPSSN